MNQLRKFREAKGLTQADLAKAAGVSQPHYRRWEIDGVNIPPAKLMKLAKSLGVTPEAILNSPPQKARDDQPKSKGPKPECYYGELAIHFLSKLPPLVLSVTDHEFSRVYLRAQNVGPWLIIQSLQNQLVAIRKSAVSDIFCSSSDEDQNLGPEDDEVYTADGWCALPRLPDDWDWKIVESLNGSGRKGVYPIYKFDDADVERVKAAIGIDQDMADINHNYYAGQDPRTRRMLDQSSLVQWRTTSGVVRHALAYSDSQLNSGMWEVLESGQTDHEDREDFIRLSLHVDDGAFQSTALISKSGLEYISVPTHQFEAGGDLMDKEDMEADEDDEIFDDEVDDSEKFPRGGPDKRSKIEPSLTLRRLYEIEKEGAEHEARLNAMTEDERNAYDLDVINRLRTRLNKLNPVEQSPDDAN